VGAILSIEYVEILKRRAQQFVKYGDVALQNEDYDLACFMYHQASELYLKAILLRLTGHVPRLHSIRQLLALLIKILEEVFHQRLNDIIDLLRYFTSRYRSELKLLDEVYVQARYAPRRYSREECESLRDLSRHILEVVKLIEERLSSI